MKFMKTHVSTDYSIKTHYQFDINDKTSAPK